jgi:hypothetical protein
VGEGERGISLHNIGNDDETLTLTLTLILTLTLP